MADGTIVATDAEIENQCDSSQFDAQPHIQILKQDIFCQLEAISMTTKDDITSENRTDYLRLLLGYRVDTFNNRNTTIKCEPHRGLLMSIGSLARLTCID